MERRGFLKTALAAAGGVAIPPLLSARAAGGGGKTPPSEQITMGIIGVGGRARQVLPVFLAQDDVRVLAVCDVARKARQKGKNMVNDTYGTDDCDTYRDMREMLARDDIDTVYIAVGDRWHSQASILAMKTGKDLYCEKPVSLTIAEGRALAEAVDRYGRIYEAGCQRRSVGNFQFAIHLARSGKLGELQTVYASIPWLGANKGRLPAQSQPPKEELDWDLWLGPVPWHAYNEKWYDGLWKRYWDFSGGGITEWGAHTLDLCQLANDSPLTPPVEYWRGEDGRMRARYENGVQVIFREDGWEGTCGVRFEGHEGWVETDDSGKVQVEPQSLQAERELHTESWKRPVEHPRDFLECVKSRERPIAYAETVHQSHVGCHAANISLRLGRKVRWDPNNARFVDDDVANRMRSRADRQPWYL